MSPSCTASPATSTPGPRNAWPTGRPRPARCQQRPDRGHQRPDKKNKRVGHGFCNLDNYRLRMLLTVGLDWYTVHWQVRLPPRSEAAHHLVAQSRLGALVELNVRAPEAAGHRDTRRVVATSGRRPLAPADPRAKLRWRRQMGRQRRARSRGWPPAMSSRRRRDRLPGRTRAMDLPPPITRPVRQRASRDGRRALRRDAHCTHGGARAC